MRFCLLICLLFAFFPWGHNQTTLVFLGTDSVLQKQDYENLKKLENNIQTLFNDKTQKKEDRYAEFGKLEKAAIKQFGFESLSHAFILHKKGVFASSRMKNPQVAITYYNNALRIRESLQRSNHSIDLYPDIIRGYNNIGNRLLYLRQPYLALDALLSGLFQADIYDNKDTIALLLQDINLLTARAYLDIGDFDNTIKYYHAVIDLRQQLFFPKEKIHSADIRIIQSLTEQGEILANQLGQIEEGLLLYRKAETLLNQHGIEGSDYNAALFNNLGLAYEKAGELVESEQYLLKAIELNEGYPDYWEDLAINKINISVTYKKMGKLGHAKQNLEEAEALLKDSLETKNYLDLVYDNWGDIAALEGNIRRGIEFDNKAVQALTSDFILTHSTDNPVLIPENIVDKYGLLESLASKAENQANLYQTEDSLLFALETFELASQLSDILRSEFQLAASKGYLTERVKPVYEKALGLCMKLYEISDGNQKYLNEAFRFSEKSRSIILLEAVRGVNASFSLPGKTVQAERELSLKKNYLEQQLAILQQEKSGDEQQEADLRKKLLISRRNYDALVKQIEQEYPDYYRIKYSGNTVSISEIQDNLKDNYTLLEYFTGEDNTYLIIINKESVRFEKIPDSYDLKEKMKALNRHIAEPGFDFYEPAFQIQEHIFAPFRAYMKTNLIIIPDGVLGYLPFDLLPTSMANKEAFYYRNFEDYVLYDYSISYLYSATFQNEIRSEWSLKSNRILGVAPDFESRFNLKSSVFSHLKHNKSTILKMEEYYDGIFLAGHQTNKNSFLELAPDFQILQLSTHAIANDSLGDLSYILFGTQNEDILYARELYDLNLDADLVFLGACQSGTGELKQGEGIISLARGFFQAGCRSVISTLWSVNDEVTEGLTLNFYKHLHAGNTKDDALRMAKIDYLENLPIKSDHRAHPHYWAAFIPIGDMNALPPFTISKLLIFFSVLLIIIGVMVWRKSKIRRSS